MIIGRRRMREKIVVVKPATTLTFSTEEIIGLRSILRLDISMAQLLDRLPPAERRSAADVYRKMRRGLLK